MHPGLAVHLFESKSALVRIPPAVYNVSSLKMEPAQIRTAGYSAGGLIPDAITKYREGDAVDGSEDHALIQTELVALSVFGLAKPARDQAANDAAAIDNTVTTTGSRRKNRSIENELLMHALQEKENSRAFNSEVLRAIVPFTPAAKK
eukprot:COSAG05_NODE_1340_length_5141_cov_2.211226_4_plen_148_part_00